MNAGDIREAEIRELLREIETEVEDRWTLLRVKAAASTRRRKKARSLPAFNEQAARHDSARLGDVSRRGVIWPDVGGTHA